MAQKWMQAARERMQEKGTVGAFSAQARKAGQSTMDFAREKKNAGGIIGKRANFALNAAKARRGM